MLGLGSRRAEGSRLAHLRVLPPWGGTSSHGDKSQLQRASPLPGKMPWL